MLFRSGSDQIVLYQFHISPYCGKIRAILNYKQLPYEIRAVSVLDRRELFWVSRQRKVPVLLDQGNVVADSTVIGQYLEEHYPLPPVYPRGRRDRAQALLWEDWADESLQRVVGPLKFFDRENARKAADSEIAHSARAGYAMRLFRPLIVAQMALFGGLLSVRRLEARFVELMELLADRLEGLYLVGDRPTVADFAVFSVLEPFEGMNGWRHVVRHENVMAWYRRVQNAAAPVAESAR
jgi:glutathione S-transferase